MTTLVVPTGALRERLAPRLPGTEVLVWDPEDPAPAPPADLLLYPYMRAPAQLSALAGRPVRAVQAQTLGYDGVAAHLPPGIVFCNAVDVHEASTAELAMALILAALRGLPDAVRAAERGAWEHRRRPGLAGRRVLLLGAGGVGRELAARLEPFDVTVEVVARHARAGVHGPDAMPALLPTADVVVLAVPLTPATTRLADAAFLDAMRPGALLVNVSRGPVVDTDALVERLRAGRLLAALDVTDPEPLDPSHPLWHLPGALITPHLGGDTDAMDARVDRLVLEQIRRIRAGEPLANIVVERPAR